jgi:ribosomal protein S18 acetylase RimI-like enzyme
MEISRGDKENIDFCIAIAEQLKQYFTDEAISKMKIDLKNHMLYCALESGEIVGFASINKKSPDVAEISWMAVKSEHQNKGFGTALIDSIVSDLKLEGTELLEVKTLSSEIEYLPYELTRKFYEKQGFIHLETIDPYPGWEPGNPCAIYVKKL